MWKTLLSRLGGCLFLVISAVPADAQLSLTEGFDNTGNSVPTATGIFAQTQPWVNVNNSDAPNTTGFNWELGDSGTFIWTAQSPVGSTSSFAQVSFNSSTGSVVSDWLLTPVVTLEAGATFSFYTVAAKGTTFANDLQVYISTSGSSTNVGSNAQTPTGGAFTLLPGGDLNPTLSPTGYPLTQPNGWTLETFTLTSSEIPATTTGRIGLRYFIPNTATQGSAIGVDTFSFADPTIFTRAVTGNWSDSTGWTPTGVPNGNNNIADLVLPASGTQTVNLQGGTFTVNQLNVTGSGLGAWTVSNGTLIFDGTTPTFTNQSTATGITATLGVNLQLNADTTFKTQNAGAITALNGTNSGTGNVIITGLGTFLVNTAQTYSTQTVINQGIFEAGAANVFSPNSAVVLSTGGTLNLGNANQTIASLAGTGGQVVLGASLASPATLTVGGDTTSTTYAGGISGFGGLTKVGTGTLALTGSTTYTGTTTISAGTIAGGALNSLSPNSAFSISNAATLDISAASQIIGSLAGVTGSNVNLGAKTLTIGGDNTSTTFSGLISGTGSLIKNGAGTFTILGTDTYSGGTTIDGGMLQLGNGVTNGSIAGNVTGSGTLAFNENGPVTFTGAISAAAILVQEGIGTVTLTGNNTYSGATNVNSGTLQAGSSTAFSAASAYNVTSFLDLNGFNNAIGSLSGSGTVTNSSLTPATLTVGNVASTTFSGAINNGNSVLALTKVGTGTLTLTGTSTYGGATNVNAGVLAGGALNSLSPSSAFVIANLATLDISLADQTIGSLAGVAGATVNLGTHILTTGGNNTSTSYTGLITGSGILTKAGTGTLTLSGTSSYTGATNINAGVLAGGALNSLSPSSAFVIANLATLDISLADQTIGSLAGVAGATVNLGTRILTTGGNNTSTSYTGLITGSGILTKAGTGTLTLSGTSSYTGATNINAGVLAGGALNSLSSSSAFVIANLATLDISLADQTIGSLAGVTGATVNLGTHILTTGGDNTSTSYTGLITGSGILTKAGTGTLTLSGTSSYTGATNINAGVLAGGALNSLSPSSAFVIANLATLDISLADQTIGSLAGVAGATVNLGTHILTTGGNNTSTSYTGLITGSGILTKVGTGTLTLSGTSSYTGATNINAGVLAGGALNSLSPSSAFVIANLATLDISLADQTIGSLAGVAGATVNLGTHILTTGGNNTSTSYTGLITGSGILTKAGTGTLTLSGTSSYTGATNINAGVLAGGALNSLSPSSAFVIVNLATLDISLADQTIGSLAGVAGATVNLGTHILTTGGNNTSTSYTGLITGSGILTKAGTGTLTLSGTSSYTGATNINAGVLAGGALNSLSPSSAFVIANLATLDISLADQTIGSLAGVAGATVNLGTHTLTTGGDNTSTLFAGTISGSGLLIKNGSGTFTLASTNNYSGGTTIESGTVIAASNGALGTGPLLVTGASNTLEINAGATITNLVTLSNGGILKNSGTLNEGASILNVTNGGTIANTVGGVITASQIQSTLAAATLLNGGTINANITFGNFANTVQLFTGSSIVGNLDLGTNAGTNLILDGSGPALLSQAVTGTLTNAGSLVKQGTGTWTLDRDVSAPVSTNITTGMLVLAGQLTSPQVIVSNGATLQFGNGGTAGSLVGNVVDNGSIFFDRSDSLTFAGVISGAGSVTQNGSGTTVLSAINTYNGGTVVNAGTLLVNSTQALGLGNVVVNGGILGADPQPINVKGDYTQNAGGTLQLQIAGATSGQYDFLNVAGNAALGGTLQLISPVYRPKAGDRLTLVTTGGLVSGQFARFVSPFTAGPGLNTIDLVYGRNSVQLQFLNVTTPISPVIPTVPTTPSSPPAVPPKVVATLNFASFAFTPDQRSAATLLDQVQLDPRTANLIGFLFKQPLANLPGDFEQISPAGLTAFYEISFSGANIQKLNLEGRFDDIRNGASGFSSNVKVSGATVNLEDKATADGKFSKSVVEPILQPGPENRWGVWMTGFGDFVSVDADSNANGYDFTTGGVSLGIDYRILDHLVIGVMGDYAHTWTSLNPSGHIDVDTGRGGVYATWYNHGLYLNGAIYGGHNSYESSRSTLGGLAAGSTEGAEWSTFAGGGYDFNFGHLTVGPIASIQYTYVNIDGFSEKSSLAPLEIHSASAESLRTDVGFRASFLWRIGRILVEPAIKAAWEHEYKYSALPITAGFAAIPGPSATFFGPSEGHDSAVVNAGITVQLTPAIATYLNYDGQLGRDRYDSNAVTGGVRITF